MSSDNAINLLDPSFVYININEFNGYVLSDINTLSTFIFPLTSPRSEISYWNNEWKQLIKFDNTRVFSSFKN